MKNKIVILVLCLFCQFSFSQVLTRIPLYGQAVNDSIKIENGVVFNVNSKTGTVINSKGFFTILAKVNDTLVFSSLAFKTKKIKLVQKDFSSSFLRVKFQILTKQLVEVVVHAKKSIHPIAEGNSQKYVDQQYFDDEKSSPKNIALPASGGVQNGMDFVRMYKDVLKILRKNNPERDDFISPVGFTEVVMKSVSYDFFTNTLNLKDDEIGLFLIFCENDSKSKTLLKTESQFELIDFLIAKNKEFKGITTFEKEK
ncbi:hypothetical protein [Flavobacterium sp.]|uniref:hypothetical protein n=1 Tax=Flavobacterium sp. TaxID=239 RepID=UPI00379DD8DD